MTDTTKLPPLPEPDCDHYGGVTGWQVVGRSFSKQKMLDFGSECRRMALEEAAKLCEQSDGDGEGPDCWGWNQKDYARAIRAMKDKA